MASVRGGLFPPVGQRTGGPEELHVALARNLGLLRRYAAVRDHVTREATEAGRDPSGFEHALNVWCGFAATREAGREPLATQMQDFYQMPFEPFERCSPYGTPEDVAEFLGPYIEAGCSAFNVIPCAGDDESAMAAVGELRTLLTASPKR